MPRTHREMDRVFAEVFNELLRQNRLRDSGKFKDTARDFIVKGEAGWMVAVLGEEFDEVCRAVNDDAPAIELRTELIQVAAVALSAVMGIDELIGAEADSL
jgi:hypothetical protein